MECVYLIRHNETGLHKIGMTADWVRRSRELKVGQVTTEVRIVRCRDAQKWEKVLHSMFKHKRIPQSEWFRISAEEAIPKMEWLAAKTNQSMIVGNWQQAKAGHYYRRRRSSSGNWYTETKSAMALQQEAERRLTLSISSAVQERTRLARKEAGYWATKNDPSKIEWAPKDPTYNESGGWMMLVVASVILAAVSSQPVFLIIAVAAVLFALKG